MSDKRLTLSMSERWDGIFVLGIGPLVRVVFEQLEGKEIMRLSLTPDEAHVLSLMLQRQSQAAKGQVKAMTRESGSE